MPHPKKVSAYPDFIVRIGLKLAQGETVILRNPKRRVVENTRFSFYGFRKAVESEKAHQMFPNLHRISVRIYPEPGQWVLVFEDMDNTPQAKMVTQALGEEPATHLPIIAEPLQVVGELTESEQPSIMSQLIGTEDERKHKANSMEKLIEEMYGPAKSDKKQNQKDEEKKS